MNTKRRIIRDPSPVSRPVSTASVQTRSGSDVKTIIHDRGTPKWSQAELVPRDRCVLDRDVEEHRHNPAHATIFRPFRPLGGKYPSPMSSRGPEIAIRFLEFSAARDRAHLEHRKEQRDGNHTNHASDHDDRQRFEHDGNSLDRDLQILVGGVCDAIQNRR